MRYAFAAKPLAEKWLTVAGLDNLCPDGASSPRWADAGERRFFCCIDPDQEHYTGTITLEEELMPHFSLVSTLGVVFLAATTSAHAGDCIPEWDPGFGDPGANSGIVFDLTSHDDGTTGEQLYASGSYTAIGGVAANRVARWDGAAWHALGTGLSNNEAYAIASYGGDLYAAGYFDLAGGVAGTAKLARWDGENWNSIGAQLELFSNQLWDLVPWDDGTGEALYIAGNFADVGAVTGASFIAKWDGKDFAPLGTPIGGAVPLIIFTAYAWDDGSGEQLYVGGRFLNIDGVPANRIAKWDGTQWTALGTGITGPGASPSVMSMVAFDDGGGEALYVAGQTFNNAGGVAVSRIARWNGTEWSAVGDGFADGIVWGLEVFDDGVGCPELYAFGSFTASGATPILRVARWTGIEWEQVDDGADATAFHSAVFDDGSGAALYLGGQYTSIGGVTANRIARRSACEEPLLGDATGDGMVNFGDIIALLAAWGDCPPMGECPADFDCNGTVNFNDLLTILANWT